MLLIVFEYILSRAPLRYYYNTYNTSQNVRLFRLGYIAEQNFDVKLIRLNKVNELAWIVSLTFAIVSFTVLCDHNIGQGHHQVTR